MTVPQRERPDRLTRMEDSVAAYRARSRRREPSTAGLLAQRLTAAAIAVVFAGFLVAIGLFTVTEAGPAERIIARALPTLTQVGELLAIHGPDLKAAAAGSGNRPVRLAGYPVDATLTPTEVAKDSPQALQLLLDIRGSRAIYEHGAAAFNPSGGHGTLETGPLLSGPWILHEVISLLNRHTHARFVSIVLPLSVFGLALIALFCLQVEGYGRLVGTGVAGLFGSLAAGLGTLFIWLVVQLFYNDAASPLASAGWGITADVLWTLVLIDGVGLACSCALIGGGLGLAAWDREPAAVRDTPAGFSGRPVPRRRRPLD